MATAKTFDLQQWWMGSGASQFPVISRLAEQFLVISATSAAVERQFSKSKQLKPKNRQSLSALHLQEMVIIINNWAIAESLIQRVPEPERNPKHAKGGELMRSSSPRRAVIRRAPKFRSSSDEDISLFDQSD
jgi:hypothetical protein